MPRSANNERAIWVYGNPDQSEFGFPMPGDLTEYLRTDVFAKENGRYRQTQTKNADVIVLSRFGLAYGHLEIDAKVKPEDVDRVAYPRVKSVYLVRRSTLYQNPVPLSELSIAGVRFGKRLTEETFQELLQRSGGQIECSKPLPLPESEIELERVRREVLRRLGQSEFRRILISAYGRRCAITGCDAVHALEAAHITPFCDVGDCHPSNGVLLRADLHSLFDQKLLAIDPVTLKVVCADALRATCYAELEEKSVRLPEDPALRPSPEALATQWKRFSENFRGQSST